MESSSTKLRIKALVIDYLCIVLYLIVLFALTIGFYFLLFDGVPEFTEEKIQWIALLTSVFPITMFFTIKEASKSFASIGKKKAYCEIFKESNFRKFNQKYT